MEPKKFNSKDFFLNLGAIVALYAVVVSLVNLLFTIINYSYPKVVEGYNYYYSASPSISWPVASLIVVFPILILLMWVLEREYKSNPKDRNTGIHKALTFVTLFIAGLVIAGDLVTVLYYFLDGQELTVGFLLKVLVLLVVSGALFVYYLSDIRGTLTSKSRKVWRVVTGVVILGSIVWGFSVLGSPATQRLYKYDNQKISNLQEINNYIQNFYSQNGKLPENLTEAGSLDYMPNVIDQQTKKPYEYVRKDALNYSLCAEFNKASDSRMDKLGSTAVMYPYGGPGIFGAHPAGRYCFEQKINPNMFAKPLR
ncbi:MAG: hypothetical protein EXS47_00030 [Candidatus Zambryskibacteria bacterium]|nr:hypothetical protein [Candidatus Zambryskibacteria bacterium]